MLITSADRPSNGCTAFSRALRERGADLLRQPVDQLRGADAALRAVYDQVHDRLHQEGVQAVADAYEKQVAGGNEKLFLDTEQRYEDCLDRLQTPRQLYPQNVPTDDKIRQGIHGNCVVSSALLCLAHQRPWDITQILTQDEAATIHLKLPGQSQRTVPMPNDWSLVNQTCAYQNGIWLTVMADELGEVGALWQSRAISAITGNNSDLDRLWWTSQSATSKKMTESLNNSCIVIAGRNGRAPEVPGMDRNHSYAVLEFNPTSNTMLLQDPTGNEPVGPDGLPLDGKADGRFEMTVERFHQTFSSVLYESRRGQRKRGSGAGSSVPA